MKVAILDHTATLGGAELALVRTLHALPTDAPEVSVILFAEGPLAGRLRAHGTRVAVLPLDRRLAATTRYEAGGLLTAARSALAVVPFVWTLSRLLRREGIEVVHTTSLKADLIGMVAARLARARLVWHIHDRISTDYLPRPVVAALRVLSRRVPDVVIANSRATAATVPGARRLRVIHPGLAPEQIGPEPDPQPRPTTSPVIGIVGRISPTKGQRELVQAAPIILAVHPHARFRVIGEASFGAEDYEALVRREAVSLGVADRFDFVGFVDDVAREMASLTLCVHASPVPEPFGQVIAEAMAQGTPVVATNAGGAPEILTDEDSDGPLGWLVEPGDVAGLADAVVDALSNPQRRAEQAVRAWHSVARRFRAETAAEAVTAAWFDSLR